MLRWTSLILVLARMGCDHRDGSADASGNDVDGAEAIVDVETDATDAAAIADVRMDVAIDAGADARCPIRSNPNPDPRDPCCDLGAHVDCFWSAPSCTDGVVRVPIHRPIDTCTNAQAQALYHSGICQRLAGRFDCDPRGCRARPNPRAQACLDNDRQGLRANLLCASMDHREGAPCATHGDCWNSDIRPHEWLRCDSDAGRCAWALRDRDAGVGPTSCATDNDCPAGQVCALDSACRGACAAIVDGGLTFAVPRSDAGASGNADPIPPVEAGFATWDAAVIAELDVP